MNRFEGKRALVTGGLNGIGLGCVKRFLNEGAEVIIWDVQEELASQRIEELNAKGRVQFQKVNLAHHDSVVEAVKALGDKSAIDILINNAGITRDAQLKKMSEEQWQSVIDVNLSGVYHATRYLAPGMMERAYGRVISIASVVALYGNFGQSNYVAAKSGVIGLTKVWAREFGKYGVTANAIAPGFIETDMVDTIPDNVKQMIQFKTPMQRMGKIEEVVAAICFLASEEASFVNGQTLGVDGGLVA
jgi:3-oxoacyl-[acyl-carrier protein] reductase